MKKKLFTAAYPNGIPSLIRKREFRIEIDAEINTELDFYGFVFLLLPVHGSSAMVHLHHSISSGMNGVITDLRNIISTQQNEAGKVNIFRKNDYGHIFIKNRSPFTQRVILYYFEP